MEEVKKTIVSSQDQEIPVSFEVLTLWDQKRDLYETFVFPCFNGIPEEGLPLFYNNKDKKKEATQIHEQAVKILSVNPGYMSISAALSAISLKQDSVYIHDSLKHSFFHQPQLKN